MSPRILPLATILRSLTLSAASAETVTWIPKALHGVGAAYLDSFAPTDEYYPYTNVRVTLSATSTAAPYAA